MLVLILLVCAGIFLLITGGILGMQAYRVRKGVIVIDEAYNGPAQVSTTLHIVIRFLLKRSVYLRKFVIQYVLHFMVRLMYHFDVWTTKLYAKSRNWFVKNAVENKGTVPHFWNHLKIYKQEIDKEKEEKQKVSL